MRRGGQKLVIRSAGPARGHAPDGCRGSPHPAGLVKPAGCPDTSLPLGRAGRARLSGILPPTLLARVGRAFATVSSEGVASGGQNNAMSRHEPILSSVKVGRDRPQICAMESSGSCGNVVTRRSSIVGATFERADRRGYETGPYWLPGNASDLDNQQPCW